MRMIKISVLGLLLGMSGALYGGGSMTQTYTAAPAEAIPDGGCPGNAATSTITIPASDVGFIEDVDVEVEVTHTWRGDLEMTLSDGTDTVVLADDHGENAASDNYHATFDSASATACAVTCDVGTNCDAPPGPTCSPDESLDAYNGAGSANRAFTLSVCDDDDFADMGDFDAWSLTVQRGAPVIASTTMLDVTEGDSVSFDILLSSAASDDVTVPVSADGDCSVSSASGSPMGPAGAIDVIIPSGSTMATVTVSAAIDSDDDDNDDETCNVTLGTTTSNDAAFSGIDPDDLVVSITGLGAPAVIPTLSQWSLIGLAGLLILGGLFTRRRFG